MAARIKHHEHTKHTLKPISKQKSKYSGTSRVKKKASQVWEKRVEKNIMKMYHDNDGIVCVDIRELREVTTFLYVSSKMYTVSEEWEYTVVWWMDTLNAKMLVGFIFSMALLWNLTSIWEWEWSKRLKKVKFCHASSIHPFHSDGALDDHAKIEGANKQRRLIMCGHYYYKNYTLSWKKRRATAEMIVVLATI